MKTKPKKKVVSKKKVKTPARTYLREVKIRFKKKRVKAGSPVGKRVTDAQQIVKLFSDLKDEAKENFITISLDTRMHIICFEVVAIGSVNAVYLRPGEAVRAAVGLNANGVVVLHNHPSGDPKPSRHDKKLTKDLKTVTDALGFGFHDHIIIGDDTYYSFGEHGLL